MYRCKICGKKYTELTALYNHIEDKHKGMIPKDMSVQQYYYYMKTGRMNGNCVMCKQPTSWNHNTGKYNRFCGNPKCKDEYVKIMKSRMVAKYGKTHLLNDPSKQREMLAHRSISGTYTWSDGKHESTYTGSYELDFLKTLDNFFDWDPEDISMPSPHTYTYKYEGEDKFYIPDVFIHSLDLEIEIKDGGDNPNNHHKIQEVDKEKERLKDEVLCSQKAFHYIKITNKNYENFFRFLKEIKKEFEKHDDEKEIPRIFKIEDIKGTNVKPVKESTEILEESNYNKVDDLIDDFREFNHKPFREHDLFLSLRYDLVKNDPKELQNFLSKLIKTARYKDDIVYVEKMAKKANDYYKIRLRKHSDIKDAYDKYYDWLKCGGIDKDIRDRKDDFKLIESIEIVEENLFVSKDNIEVNLDKFGGLNNILYITGLGGSGKSTIISKYAKEYGAEALEFDAITSALIRGLENLNRNKIHPIILEYLETQNPNKLNGFGDPAFNTESVKFLDWFENKVAGDGKLYVLEGMQLFICFEPERFIDKPMIIMGTSVTKSMFRSVSRTYKRSEGDIIKTFKFFLKTLKRIPIFVKNDKQINELIDTISECYIEEKFEPDKFLVWFDKPLKKLFNQKVTLYNGSSVDKGNILTPRSVNVGATKYSDPRWSTFFWDKYEYAERWAVIWAIQRIENKPCLYQGNDKKTIIAKTKNMSDDEYIDYLLKRKQVIYIYECDVDVRKIEIGSVPSIKEYTISEEVPVDRKKKIVLTKELVKRHVELMPLNDLKELMNNIDYTNHIPNVRGPILNKILSNERDDYREIVMNDVRSGKINKGDDISGYKTRINQAIKDNEFGLRESNDIIEEKFEPDKFLVWFDKPIQKLKGGKIKLYHGSSIKIKDKIDPISINVGATKYSTPRWSTYFWDNKEDAMSWALTWNIWEVVGPENIEFAGHNNKGKSIVIKPNNMTEDEFKKHITNNIKPFYVYEVEIDINDLEIGSCPSIREYTVSKPVDIVKTYTYTNIKGDVFKRFIDIKTMKEYKEYVINNQKLKSIPHHRGFILNNILKDYRDPYRGIIRTDMRNGNIKPGDDLSDYKYSINRHFNNDTYGLKESYIIDTMKESSISIPQMSYYLQNQYEEDMKDYLNTYKKYYNLMLKEQPAAVKHINEDIRQCLVVIDGLAAKGVENNLVQFAKDDLGEIVKASKKGKPVKVYESMVEDMVNIDDSTNDIHLITVQNDNVSISNEIIECKLVYNSTTNKQLFSLRDVDSKLIIENSYVIQRDSVGTHCSVTPYYNDIREENSLSFYILLNESIDISELSNKINKGITLTNLFKFNDNGYNFIKESCLRLFDQEPIDIIMESTDVDQAVETICRIYKKAKDKYGDIEYIIDEFLIEPREYFVQIWAKGAKGKKDRCIFKKSFIVDDYPGLDKKINMALKKIK